MISHAFLLCFIIGSVMVLSLFFKKLTVSAAFVGGLLGLAVYAGAGFTGIALLGAFFLIGTASSSFRHNWKEQSGLAEKRDRKRTAGQVVANGGVAGIIGFSILLFPQYATVLQTMLAASLASATADTVSSELGVIYGRQFYNIRSFKKDVRGLDGVVSWEGTVLGLLGSLLIAGIYAIGFGLNQHCIVIALAGLLGNLFDSYLGAIWERRRLLSNNAVNFLNTAFAALAAGLLLLL